MRTDIVSELYVDDPTVGDKIPVNIRMSLPGIGLDQGLEKLVVRWLFERAFFQSPTARWLFS